MHIYQYNNNDFKYKIIILTIKYMLDQQTFYQLNSNKIIAKQTYIFINMIRIFLSVHVFHLQKNSRGKLKCLKNQLRYSVLPRSPNQNTSINLLSNYYNYSIHFLKLNNTKILNSSSVFIRFLCFARIYYDINWLKDYE